MPTPKHTELSILESYLLPPSPLPTALPYTTFQTLIPTQHRTNPALKRLYRALQLQRTIDIDTVRLNIERECSRAPLLKAHLSRRIAESEARDQGGTRKRKRTRERDGLHGDDDDDENRDSEGQGEGGGGGGGGVSVDETGVNDTLDTAIDATYQNTTLHPAHVDPSLPVSSNHPLTTATRRYHTPASLTSALKAACSALESEIADLEGESAGLLAEMDEIVGSLSDLRYGRFARPVSDDGGDGHGTGTVEGEVLEALRGLERRIEETIGS